MKNKIENIHENWYDMERQSRWDMANDGEENAITIICNSFSSTLDIPIENVTYERLDKIWFDKYDIDNPKNEWVKGAPDFFIRIALSKNMYILVEIKLKSKEFKKTIKGGTTKAGSKITKYGCTSFYIDIVPVYKNMNDFVLKTNKKYSAFLIAFVKDDFSEINIISLSKLNKIINNGWKRNDETINICVYGEGYGKETYLIPKCETISLSSITKTNLKKILLEDYPRPSAK